MRAALLLAYGPPQSLKIGEAPKPVIRNDEILVRIHASSMNPLDWRMRSGKLSLYTGRRPPAILGHDFAGSVDQIGAKITAYRVGDRVFGMSHPLTGGCHAEFVKVKSECLAPLPARLSFEQAAALPLAALTAYQGLMHSGRLQSGQAVLINGASGAVGSAAVQIAKAAGCRVTAVCSTRNLTFVQAIGADAVIDYTREEIGAYGGRHDVFFDCVGSIAFGTARPLLKPGGRFVSTEPLIRLMLFSPLLNLFRAQKAVFVRVRPNSDDLKAIVRLVEQDQLKPAIERVFALEEIAAAHALSETRRVVGKLVIKIA